MNNADQLDFPGKGKQTVGNNRISACGYKKQTDGTQAAGADKIPQPLQAPPYGTAVDGERDAAPYRAVNASAAAFKM